MLVRFGRPFGVLALGLLWGCSGGGGGGLSGPVDSPVLLSIEALGASAPLWAGSSTSSTQPCPASGLPINTAITFTFGGAVDVASVPGPGAALGGINITMTSGATFVPAQGGFTVEDDPALPSGNRRRVVFRPAGSVTPGLPALTGLMLGGATYSVFVPAAGGAPEILTVAGVPLSNTALTCFTTCNPANGGCLYDPTPGPAFVTATLPETGDPAPSPIPSSAFGNSRLSIFFSEPLDPLNINLQSVILRDSISGAQVPGSVQFFQSGSPEAGPVGARIDYILSGVAPPGRTLELVITNVVRDVFGAPVALYLSASAGPGVARRQLHTATLPYCLSPPIIESFTTTQNLASESGAAQWIGNGQVQATLPTDLIGNGAFGPMDFNAPGNFTLDSGMAPAAGFANGTWDITSLNIVAGANVRLIGPRQVWLRTVGTVNIAGNINASAGMQVTAPLGNPEQGAKNGNFNNGQGVTPNIVAGGVGNAGGGAGGRASYFGAVRTPSGETGFGSRIDGQPNTGPAGNADFGGGQGGDGGFRFPNGGVAGELGGLGGAGGSALGSGSNGGPFTSVALGCMPSMPPNFIQPRALATGAVLAFLPPIATATAGSGGGGGGDRFEISGVTSDDQGGGGGAGGGAFRITAFENITIASTAQIQASGGPGGMGNVFFAGAGGGGSGGQIWLQSFKDIMIAATASLAVNGGLSPQTCTDFGGGRGGLGLYQFEDQDGMVPTNFIGPPPGMSNVVNVPFALAQTISGTATSTFYDTGDSVTDFVSAMVTGSVGSIPGASFEVGVQGAYEAVSGGVPDLMSLSPILPAASIDQLDGYRYVRLIITLTTPTPSTPVFAGTPPSVDEVVIQYRTTTVCP